MAEKLGGGKPKKSAKLHMNIHKMDDGKFLVQHDYRGGTEPTPESSQHAPASMKELVAHLGKHYGEDAPEPPAEVKSEA